MRNRNQNLSADTEPYLNKMDIGYSVLDIGYSNFKFIDPLKNIKE